MIKDNMGNTVEEIENSYKRLGQLYRAIKKTRRMAQYWRGNENSFTAWAVKKGFGKGMTIAGRDGFYSASTCRIVNIPYKNRKIEGVKIREDSGAMKSNKPDAFMRLVRRGFPRNLIEEKSNGYKFSIEAIEREQEFREKNRTDIGFINCKKTPKMIRRDIIKLAGKLRTTRAISVVDFLNQLSDDEMQIAHRSLFGKCETKEEVVVDKDGFASMYKGAIGELAVCKRAAEKGISVSKPIMEGSSYDLVLDMNGTMKKVQVKYSSRESGNSILFFDIGKGPASKRKNSHGKEIVPRLYDENEVDIFMLYSALTDKVYMIDSSLVKGHRFVYISLRDMSSKGPASFFSEEVEW